MSQQVRIERVSNGYIVTFGNSGKPVGVYQSWKEVIAEIANYFRESDFNIPDDR